MERIFAAIDNGIISNTFVADDAFAELVRPDHDDVVEVTDMDPRPSINWTVEADGYRPPAPYPSWVWDSDSWVPPVPRPTEPGAWVWRESEQSWVDIDAAVS